MTTFKILTQLPEELFVQELRDEVIPALRFRLINLIEKNPGIIRTPPNYRADNILQIAKAICGPIDEMTVNDMNRSVYILREEYHLVRVELQKRATPVKE